MKHIGVSVAVAVLLLSSVAGMALADGPGYALDWWTVDGGGCALVAGSYALGGTAGQPDADTLGGGDYALTGGFWGSGAARHGVYLPLVLRND